MREVSGKLKKRYRRCMALLLTALLLGLQGLSAFEPLEVYAYPVNSRSDMGDMWEELEDMGEVAISFPSQIEASISSPEDEDRYSFRLEGETDLAISLESEYPCGLDLISNGSVIGSSHKPYSQYAEYSDLETGTYAVRVTPLEGTKSSEYTLRIFRQMEPDGMPDYSEAHIAGTMYDPESPYRYLNISNPEEKNRGSAPIAAMHYLAHWQGPVDESVVPYYDKGDFKETPSNYIHYKEAKPEFHGQNVFILPGNTGDGEHVEHWKNAIMTYGTIDTGFTISLNYGDRNEGDGMPDMDFRYFYAPEDWEYDKYGGHASLIVGWDDTIKRENFRITKRDWVWNNELQDFEMKIIDTTMPEHDGAWICRDSYGNDNLDSYPDFYYVSYESADFGTASHVPLAFSSGERSDNYNHLYSNSAGGLINSTLFSRGSLVGTQVFQNDGEDEVLRSVGFASGTGEVSYEIGVRIGEGPIVKVKSGYLKYPGLYTVRLDEGVMIPGGSDFEIHTALTSDDENCRVSFYTCRNAQGWINGVKEIPGKSFYYKTWDEEAEKLDASAKGEYPCIYAYTYSPSNGKITLLDNKEKAKEYDPSPATPSDADKEETPATPSDADKEETPATPSNADKKAVPAIPPDAEKAQRKALDLRKTRTSAEGVLALEDAESVQVSPLNLNFPERYDSRDYNLITEAKNQGNSNLCWAFAIAGALEASYLRYGNQLINYPRGINISSSEHEIAEGTISLKLKKGEKIPLKLSASLYSDSEYFYPGTPQICWELAGDISSIESGQKVSVSGEETAVLTAAAPGKITVTAVSLADVSLKAVCQIEITEQEPAKVSIRPEALTMETGQKYKLETTVEAEEELTVLYSSDRPDIVSVDRTGQVLALKPGTAVITAKAGDGQAVCRITVRRSSPDDDDSETFYDPGQKPGDTVWGSWEQRGEEWCFKKADGSYAGSSWERIGGEWYYFKEDTYIAFGWFYDPSYQRWFYLDPSGAMVTGWRQINGIWYYFQMVSDGQMGRMYAGERTPDGYETGPDGAWIP